jgi:hypothetical protein
VDRWLLAGRKPGTRITAEQLRKRLAAYGITSRPGRHGALLALPAGSPHRSSPSASASTKPAPRNGPHRRRHLQRLRRAPFRA